jgi:hypothetical protein
MFDSGTIFSYLKADLMSMKATKYRCREMKETKEKKEKEDKKESEKKDKIWDLVSDLNPY